MPQIEAEWAEVSKDYTDEEKKKKLAFTMRHAAELYEEEEEDVQKEVQVFRDSKGKAREGSGEESPEVKELRERQQ